MGCKKFYYFFVILCLSYNTARKIVLLYNLQISFAKGAVLQIVIKKSWVSILTGAWLFLFSFYIYGVCT